MKFCKMYFSVWITKVNIKKEWNDDKLNKHTYKGRKYKEAWGLIKIEEKKTEGI